MGRAGFTNEIGKHIPQGLKPAFFQAPNSTTEAVPYPKPICETSSMWFSASLDVACPRQTA